MKTRREFVQGLIVSVGGVAALGACSDEAGITATSVDAPGRFHTAEAMALLNRVSDLIIPRTETPGALDVNVPGYLDGLMADWASTATRDVYRTTLQTLRQRLDRATGGDFLAVAEAPAQAALAALDAEAFGGDSSLAGYRTLKQYITQAYFATEAGALQELQWQAVPGRWDPSVAIGNG